MFRTTGLFFNNQIAKTFTRSIPANNSYITITSGAVAKLKEIINRSSASAEGVILGVNKKGCASLSHTFQYVEKANPNHDVIEKEGLKIFIDPKDTLHLMDTHIDCVKNGSNFEFIFQKKNSLSNLANGDIHFNMSNK